MNNSLRFSFIFIAIFNTCDCIEDEQFTECKRPYSCGSTINPYISYPFWGNDRPSFCGLQGFELTCQDNNFSLIHIDSHDFRVLDINQLDYTMTIARTDWWNTTCPQQFLNTTLNYDPFDPISTNGDLSLFYNCSSSESALNEFTCAIDGTENSDAFYGAVPAAFTMPMCSVSVSVPLLASAFADLWLGKIALQDALKQGFEVEYKIDGKDCDECEKSGGTCGSHNSSLPFICFCSNGSYPVSCRTPDTGSKISLHIAIAIGGAATIGMLVVGSICCFRRKVSSNSMAFWRGKTKNDQKVEAFIKHYGSLAPKRYSYSDVKKITNSFKDKLGQGGYGNVYKGKLLDGRAVAVKVLKESKGNGEEFINEVASISRTSHVNVVTLLGFCLEGHKRALIYEFMPNGSLEKFIYTENPLKNIGRQLGWEKLQQIAIGIAQGLEYLHRGCNTRILHFDIKPHNILLDEAFCPKISDFGLAKLCTAKESVISMMEAKGTIGYIAPEVFSRNFGGVSHKSDVYSYGMMVLEMVGGRKNIDVGAGMGHTSEIYFPHWVYKRLEVDNNLGLQSVITEEDNIIARKMVVVGLWCIQTDPSHRPSMSEVMKMLEGSIEDLQIPPKPFLYSPSRSPPNPST